MEEKEIELPSSINDVVKKEKEIKIPKKDSDVLFGEMLSSNLRVLPKGLKMRCMRDITVITLFSNIN